MRDFRMKDKVLEVLVLLGFIGSEGLNRVASHKNRASGSLPKP